MTDNLPALVATKHRSKKQIDADFKEIEIARIGRPPVEYNHHVANEIIELVASGRGFVRIATMPKMPSLRTMYQWLESSAPFREAYRRAYLLQADSMADEIELLADEPPRLFTDASGSERVDAGWVSWQRNRIEAKRWLATKKAPRVYGDKLELEGNGVVGIVVQVNLTQNGGS